MLQSFKIPLHLLKHTPKSHLKFLTVLSAASFATQTQNQPKKQPISFQPITTHKSSFNKKPEAQSQRLSKPNNQNKAVNVFLQDCIARSQNILKEQNLLTQYNEKTIHSLASEFWTVYLHIAKVLPYVKAFEKSNLTSNHLIPNEIFGDQNLIKQLDSVLGQITKAFENNEAKILEDLSTYSFAIKPFTKFESIQRNIPFWNVLYRTIEILLAQKETSPVSKETLFHYINFLKAISNHQTYLKETNNKDFEAHLRKTQEIKAKIFEYLARERHSEIIGFQGWVFLYENLEATGDDLQASILQIINERIAQQKDINELAECMCRMSKSTRNSSEAEDLYRKLETMAFENITSDKLTVRSVNLLLKGLMNSARINEEKFLTLWNNFLRATKSGATEYNAHEIGSLMILLNKSKKVSEEKMKYLQHCALIALNKTAASTKKQQETIESEEEEGQTLGSHEFMVNSCIILLNQINYINNPLGVNFDLLHKLLAILQENMNLMHIKYTGTILNTLSRLSLKFQKYKENHNQDIHNMTKPFAENLDRVIAKGLSGLKPGDQARIFSSLCILEHMTSQRYENITKILLPKLEKFPFEANLRLLQGLQHLKDISTEALEPTINKRLELQIQNLAQEELLQVLQESMSADSIVFAPQVKEALSKKFLNFAPSMKIWDLASLMYLFEKGQILTVNLLQELAPFIVQRIYTADIRSLSLIAKIFINKNAITAEILQAVEDQALGKIESMPENNLHSIPELVDLFYNLTKYQIKNQKLILAFENLVGRMVPHLRIHQLLQSITALETYQSKDVALIKRLLASLEKMLQGQIVRESILSPIPTNIKQLFQHGIYGIEIDYNKEIDLKDYPEILKVHQELMKDINKIRYQMARGSKYQANLAQELKLIGYSIQEEYPVGIYMVDIFVEPNVTVEIKGPDHFVSGSRELTWRSAKKERQLKKLGYKTVSIPFDEWNMIEISETKAMYLKRKIEAS